ncbi:thioredoxin domain-containing protein [Aureisphaera galaxeae]|uniref:thioredoxin domain-containing protein n=1 Tax=Aureisphaera galaxeae TaxID=1538023 RepID=UPI00234FCE1F|nr:thioredoxin domain-containing protein [Aureisphaera galaxeae]MDC8005701.1 thioredoxin domain-containing protein [Aureisphaera galaxeae]
MNLKLIPTLCFLLLSTIAAAQPFNQEITPEGKSPYLLGKINKEGFAAENYPWFAENYDAYQPNEIAVDTLQRHLDKYTITAFMGTWCGDSKREVPRFYKVLEATNFPMERLTMVAVSRDRDTYKQSPGGEHESLNIHRVPTFVVYKNGREVNRIVESPVVSLEEDLAKIIDKDYTPNYAGVTLVHEMLMEMDLQKFERKQKKLISKLKETLKSPFELNTYSTVLFYAHRKEEALAVGKLNVQLFPDEPRIYASLGAKYGQMGDYENATKNYEKAISMDPENERFQNALKELQSSLDGM